jgi:hypothetical protein
MYKDKITVIIQGPLHPNSLIAIRTLSRDFNIVISTWKTNTRDEKNLDLLLERGDHVTVVSHSLESLAFKNNDSNRFYQFYTTYKGALLVETEFCIKMRADEYYTNLVPLAEALLKEPDKLICNDVFVRNPDSIEIESFHCHPSDHLYGAKTETLVKAMKLSLDECKDKKLEELDIKYADLKNRTYRIVPEQHLFANFILAKDPEYNFQSKAKDKDEKLKLLLKENCEIVPCSELGFYSVSYMEKYSFYPKEEFFDPRKDLKKL